MKAFGLPFAYDHFAEGESTLPPFVVYRYASANNFSADGVVYYSTDRAELGLYTDRKDIVLEKRLEGLLTASEIAYEKSETWIPSERLYEVLYGFDEIPQQSSI